MKASFVTALKMNKVIMLLRIVPLLLLMFHTCSVFGQTICLNMIVKDESRVIRRCLESVKPLIDYWVIVDTGSTDGTQELIREVMQGIPGELHERPWVNFGHNRNEALSLTKTKGDYILFMDADEMLVFDDSFVRPHLDKDLYYIVSQHLGTRYLRRQMINHSLDWQWHGVVHEFLDCSTIRSDDTLSHVINIVHLEGSRSRDPDKYRKDAELLEKALEKDPHNTRDIFYLAQSYRDAHEFAKALETYKKRVAMEGWDQEIFWSLYQIALLQDVLEMPSKTCIDSYCKAHEYRSCRAEPLYHLVVHYRKIENPLLGYFVAKSALSIPIPNDGLFVERWIYEYGLRIEFANCAYALGKFDEAEQACREILAQPSLPDDLREAMEGNLQFLRSLNP